MRTPALTLGLAMATVLVTTLATPALAADNCQPLNWLDVSAEDASIMASVRPMTRTVSRAADPCQPLNWLDVSAEDASIMASVRPQPAAATRPAPRVQDKHVLHGLPDYFGRMSEEDLSQLAAVQPQGDTIVVCSRQDSRHN